MKSFLFTVFLILFIFVVFNYNKEIIKFITKEEIVIKESKNERSDEFIYFKNTTNFKPDNYRELLNVYYTFLNKGWDDFTFYCGRQYEDCLNDMEKVSSDSTLLSNINNFINPANSFNEVYTSYTFAGKITLRNERLYSDEMLLNIYSKVDEIYNNRINDSMDTLTKIRTIHDYIINTTKYDEAQIYPDSSNAYGLFMNGYAVCGGYSDAMSFFLIKMGIPNIKISNESHIWNLVKIDDSWYHLDLTWDDPVTSDNSDILDHIFFMIDTQTLKSMDTKEHSFNENIFLEAK